MVKKGYVVNLEKQTQDNTDFRRVLYTAGHSQLVLMCLNPGEEIGEEIHSHLDQFFRFEAGEGIVLIDGVNHSVKDGDGVIVPAGASHNVTNTSKTAKLKLYTIYSPPEHIDKTIRHTKQEAIDQPEEYDGKPTE
jgi:mannose-6-phosphate isomerase-like protein (cupin superfamily)